MTTPPSVSRRRVLVGAAWAAPVVVLASAVPAAAASQPVLGGLLVSSASGYQNSTVMTLNGLVTYFGDGAPPTDYPVSAVRMTVVVPLARLAAGNGTLTGAGWTFVSRVDNSGAGTATFTYAYATALSESATAAAPLSVTLPKAAADNRTSFTVTMRASGTSNSVAVQSSPVTVTVGAYSLLTVPALTLTRDTPNGSARFIRVIAPVLNSNSTNQGNVVNLVATITVPNSALNQSPTPTVGAGSWTYTSKAVGATNTVFTYTYTGGAIAPSAATTAASFNIPMVIAVLLDTPTITVTYTGNSPVAAGYATTVTASGTLGYNYTP